jgi:hypothetical protein
VFPSFSVALQYYGYSHVALLGSLGNVRRCLISTCMSANPQSISSHVVLMPRVHTDAPQIGMFAMGYFAGFSIDLVGQKIVAAGASLHVQLFRL